MQMFQVSPKGVPKQASRSSNIHWQYFLNKGMQFWWFNSFLLVFPVPPTPSYLKRARVENSYSEK